jgi:hypothetical protein
MARMHVLLHAVMEGDAEAITEAVSFEGDSKDLARQVIIWLEHQATEVRKGLTDEESRNA